MWIFASVAVMDRDLSLVGRPLTDGAGRSDPWPVSGRPHLNRGFELPEVARLAARTHCIETVTFASVQGLAAADDREEQVDSRAGNFWAVAPLEVAVGGAQ